MNVKEMIKKVLATILSEGMRVIGVFGFLLVGVQGLVLLTPYVFLTVARLFRITVGATWEDKIMYWIAPSSITMLFLLIIYVYGYNNIVKRIHKIADKTKEQLLKLEIGGKK